MATDDSFYRRFFEVLPDGSFLLEQRTGVILDANPALAALYGYGRDEVVGMSSFDVSAEPEASRSAVAAGQRGHIYRLHRKRDGTRFQIETSAGGFDWNGERVLVGITRDVTAQHEFERELRRGRALLESAFEKSPLLMSIATLPERRFVGVNDAFCRAVGHTREELLGRTSAELGLVPPAQAAQMSAHIARDGGLGGYDYAMRSRSGEEVRLRMFSKVVETSHGPRLFTAAENWTDRARSEAARAELHSRLEKLASRLPGVVYEFRRTPEGKVSFPFASPALEGLYAVTPEQVREDAGPAFARVHPDDLPEVIASTERSAARLEPWVNEHRVQLPDGRTRWVHGNAVPEREDDGSVLWHGFITDVTERRAQEEALRLNEERFQLAMEATSEAVWDWDLVTHETYASPNYYRMLGYEPGAFGRGLSAWSSVVHPDDLPGAMALFQACADGPQDTLESEYRMRAADGSWRWVLTRGTCVARDAQGKALRMIGTNAEITERKRAQLSRVQSERLASMGLLAAGVAHEFNNPLAYVQANLEALAEDLPGAVERATRALDRVRETLGTRAAAEVFEAGEPPWPGELFEALRSAQDGTRRIEAISRGLGTFARSERTVLEPVDVNHALESAATMAQREVQPRARLVKELGELPLVEGSEPKLAQVFLNLLVNAAHAIDGPPEAQRIHLRSWSADGRVHVEVRDTGRGIAPEHLERIFEPFFTTKALGKGSGLGLSITRSIVEELGGALRVTSTPGQGTTVHVELLPSPRPRLPPVVASPHAEQAGARGRVLVVDDEAAIRRSLSRVLRQHEVVLAASGREARAVLERDTGFDVILCDLMMPEMTGMELHAWLSQHDARLAERVVFVSGGAFTPAAAEYLKRVGNLRLDKPFSSAELQALVAARVGQRDGR